MKSKCNEEGCLCKDCPLRFQCFTHEQYFSDSLYQAIFEALLAKGLSEREAISQVETEIRVRINQRDRKDPEYDVWRECWKPDYPSDYNTITTWIDNSSYTVSADEDLDVGKTPYEFASGHVVSIDKKEL